MDPYNTKIDADFASMIHRPTIPRCLPTLSIVSRVPLVWISSLWIASDSATVALSSSQQASRSSESDELVVITVASPLQCWRRPRQRGRFGVEVVEATIGCWPCTVRCSGFGDEGDCSIQRTCYPKCHHVSIAEEGGKRRMPCRQTIAVSSQFHWFIHFGARGWAGWRETSNAICCELVLNCI